VEPKALQEAWKGRIVYAPAVEAPAACYDGKYRPVVEYIDYTWFHLPWLEKSGPDPRKEEARLAIRAARMARSSFAIRA